MMMNAEKKEENTQIKCKKENDNKDRRKSINIFFLLF